MTSDKITFQLDTATNLENAAVYDVYKGENKVGYMIADMDTGEINTYTFEEYLTDSHVYNLMQNLHSQRRRRPITDADEGKKISFMPNHTDSTSIAIRYNVLRGHACIGYMQIWLDSGQITTYTYAKYQEDAEIQHEMKKLEAY